MEINSYYLVDVVTVVTYIKVSNFIITHESIEMDWNAFPRETHFFRNKN